MRHSFLADKHMQPINSLWRIQFPTLLPGKITVGHVTKLSTAARSGSRFQFDIMSELPLYNARWLAFLS